MPRAVSRPSGETTPPEGSLLQRSRRLRQQALRQGVARTEHGLHRGEPVKEVFNQRAGDGHVGNAIGVQSRDARQFLLLVDIRARHRERSVL